MATFTQAQYDALTSAIASGHLRVTYDGKTVEYRDLDSMIKVRDMIARELGLGPKPCELRVLPTFSKGLN